VLYTFIHLLLYSHLLLVGEQGTASLGVEELVPVIIVSLPSNAPWPIYDLAILDNIH